MFASMPYPLLDDANYECGSAAADGPPPYNQWVHAFELPDDRTPFVLKPEFRRPKRWDPDEYRARF